MNSKAIEESESMFHSLSLLDEPWCSKRKEETINLTTTDKSSGLTSRSAATNSKKKDDDIHHSHNNNNAQDEYLRLRETNLNSPGTGVNVTDMPRAVLSVGRKARTICNKNSRQNSSAKFSRRCHHRLVRRRKAMDHTKTLHFTVLSE